jgi:hypothetical protein
MTTTPSGPRPDLGSPDLGRTGAPAWYEAAGQAPTTDLPTARHTAATGPVDTAPARVRRTVSTWVAAVIGIVAFLLGAGLSMLTGPLFGPGGGPGGPGGPGGAPGTSQQSGSTSGTSSSTTSSSTTGT